MSLTKRSILALIAALTLATQARATTIQTFTFDQLTEYAEFIFQGRVLDVRMDEAADGLIYTWVRFDVEEVVKGPSPGSELELRFVGGEIADRKVAVSEMHVPRKGERGIYFVESLDANLVNPLLGWWQGHFVITQDAEGELSITDAQGRDPAALISEEAGSTLEGKLESMKQGRSVLQSKTATPTTPEDFKQAIRARLAEGGR